jgi:hypothetical protein
MHALNVEERSDQAAKLQIEERPGRSESECESADQQQPMAGERRGLYLLRPLTDRREDLCLKGWIDLEGETSQTGDDPVAGIEIVLARNTRPQMLAKRLFFGDRHPGCQRLVNHVLKNFVTVRLHDLLLPTATVELRGLDRCARRW